MLHAGVGAGPADAVVGFFTLNGHLQPAFYGIKLIGLERGDKALNLDVREVEFFRCHEPGEFD